MPTQDKLAEQRRALPDSPGVYLFKDAGGRVLYVGKAKSIRKRVASHFGGRHGAGGQRPRLPDRRDRLRRDRRTRPRRCSPSRTSSSSTGRPSTSGCATTSPIPTSGISLDEEFPRVYFTRERHRPGRAYFGPFSSAKRVRETLDLLGKLFPYRTCEGPEPGRASGNPCLDYYIKRCQAPCVGYISQEDYRANIEAIVDFLSGRYRQIERELEEGMATAAAEQEFEQAAAYRNRLRAVRSLFERQRVASESVGTLDAIAVAVDEHRRERPGVPGARRRARRPPELLPREPRRPQRGRGGGGVRRPVLRDLAVDPARDRRPGFARNRPRA